MAQINLLPWREQARRAKAIRFGLLVLSFVVLAIIIAAIMHLYMAQVIKHQQRRLDFLNSELNKEQAELNVLNQRKKEQLIIRAKLNYIFSLREQSYDVVDVLNELARITPDDIALSKLMLKDNDITMIGRAPSNGPISEFMENIAKSSVLAQPVLTEITGKGTSTGEERIFQIKTVEKPNG